MPLLDHFHPPVSERRSWEGFHSLWVAALVDLEETYSEARERSRLT